METVDKSELEPIAKDDNVLAELLPRFLVSSRRRNEVEPVQTPVTATLVEFDLEDRPVIRSERLLAGERLTARTTVSLRRAQLGASVLILCEDGDARLPIVVGVIEGRARAPAPELRSHKRTVIQTDEERYVIEAEREVVLRCGESSITLTRAGKVIIKGNYILSRSSGYNKIKGAAVDIN